MLPGGFKKDSRVWLHKNSTFAKKGGLNPFTKCDCEGQRIGSDDPYECLPQDQFNSLDPIITDASGRIYKKDSRTWLHKSSSKKKLKTPRGGDLPEEADNRMGWIQEGHGLSAGESLEGVVRTRSSTELIRARTVVNKIKKKKTSMLMSMMVTPPPAGGAVTTIPEIRQQVGIPKSEPHLSLLRRVVL
ncbi:hypothetical protein PoB_006848600 [Plakobranchus ocellatus]|uniref:Uncharacterized protein n=1 Tax=Plakobranchus ocellatus TaxID=259542 RepID=A0AAV4DCW3_9GAST|nr:hypothetical protein PoB_006848600 [Plakobranchus ocellatus]